MRNPNPPITKVLEKELTPGETWNTDYTALGINGTNKATLEVASIPPLRTCLNIFWRDVDKLVKGI